MSDATEKLQSEINSLKEKIKKGRKDKNDITMKDYLSQNNVSIKQGSDFKLRRTLKGHLGKVYALQWADDSTNIVSASQDGNLLVWNALTTNKVTAIPLRSHWVMTCAYAPGGQFVASGGLDNICSIFNLQSKSFPIQVTRELQHHEGFVSCCRFVSDAKQIVTASGDKTCILWDVEGGNTTTIFDDMEGPIMSIAVHQSGNFFLAAGSEEKKDSGSSFVRVLDLRSGKCQRLVQPHDKDVNWVEFFPDGNAFVTASEDRTLKLFDLRADDEIMTYKHDSINANVTSATFSASGRYLFAGYEDGRCIQWNTLTGAAEYQLGGHTKRVSCVSVCKNGNALATGCWDTHLRIYTGE